MNRERRIGIRRAELHRISSALIYSCSNWPIFRRRMSFSKFTYPENNTRMNSTIRTRSRPLKPMKFQNLLKMAGTSQWEECYWNFFMKMKRSRERTQLRATIASRSLKDREF